VDGTLNACRRVKSQELFLSQFYLRLDTFPNRITVMLSGQLKESLSQGKHLVQCKMQFLNPDFVFLAIGQIISL